MQILHRLRREAQGLFDLLLPPACALCLTPLSPPDPDRFCARCRVELTAPPLPCCPRCALPYPSGAGDGHHCQTCLQEKSPLFTGVTAVGRYEGLLRDAIHRFKYRHEVNLDRPLAMLLAERLRQQPDRFDVVVPVPLHAEKLRRRTYNQSALLARRVAGLLALRFAPGLLARTRGGTPQQALSARSRADNVKDCFVAPQRLDGASVLLIDDVMTTGATIRECSRLLRRAGAGPIHVGVAARAALR